MLLRAAASITRHSQALHFTLQLTSALHIETTVPDKVCFGSQKLPRSRLALAALRRGASGVCRPFEVHFLQDVSALRIAKVVTAEATSSAVGVLDANEINVQEGK